MSRARVRLLVAVFACFGTASAWAQSTLKGIVYDPAGVAVLDAPIVVEREDTGERLETRTDVHGQFALGVAPGSYRLRVTLEPFRPFERQIVVHAHQREGVTVILLQFDGGQVTVQNGPTPREIRNVDGSLGITLTQADLEQPSARTNGGTLQSVWTITPGMHCPEQTGSLLQCTGNGLRRDMNAVSIDGAPANLGLDPTRFNVGGTPDAIFPGWGQDGSTKPFVSFSAIEKVTVRTTGVTPEHRRSPGVQTDIVTQFGSDRLAGSAALDRRLDKVSAADWFDNAAGRQRPVQFWNATASLGGPVWKGLAWHFLAWDGQHVSRPVDSATPVPSDAARESAPPLLRRIYEGFPKANGPEVAPGQAEYRDRVPVDSSLGTFNLRLDVHASPHLRIFGRYHRGRSHGDEVDAIVQQPRLTHAYNAATSTTTATIGASSVLSPRVLNELRFNTSTHYGLVLAGAAPYGQARTLPLDSLAPGLPPGNAWVGIRLPETGAFLVHGRQGDSRHEQVYVSNTLSLHRGPHAWRMGVDFRQAIVASTPAPYGIIYRLPSVDGVVQLNRAQTSIELYPPARVRYRAGSVFLQDAFQVSSRLSIAGGLRYWLRPPPTNLTDLQPLVLIYERLPEVHARPTGAEFWPTSFTEIAPQLSATFLLREDTSLYGGWSLTYGDRTPPAAVAFGRVYPYSSVQFIPPGVFPVPAEQLTPPTPAAPGRSTDYVAIADGLRSPRVYEWHAGIEHGFSAVLRCAASYVGTAATDLLYLSQSREPRVLAYSNDGRSRYHALQLECVRRLADGWSARVAYTRSSSRDNHSGEGGAGPFGRPLPPLPALQSPHSNDGPSDYDRPHLLLATLSIRPPALSGPRLIRTLTDGWQFDFVGRLESGAPVTIYIDGDLGFGFHHFRPDSVPGVPSWIPNATAPGGQQLNPAAFEIPEERRQGTHGRNSLRSFPFRQVDAALSRTIPVGPRASVQVRMEISNLFNIPNFGPPDTQLDRASFNTIRRFGQPYMSYVRALGSGTLTGGGLVPVKQIGGPRAIYIEVGLRFASKPDHR